MTPNPEKIITNGDYDTQHYHLSEILLSSDFQAHITQLAGYTLRLGYEGGVAVYADGTSKIELPEPEVIKEVAALRIGLAALRAGHETFSGHRLIFEEGEIDDEPDENIRRDIVLFVHSHPLHPDELNSQRLIFEVLRPSARDLETWEEVNLFSPGHTEGILAPTPKSRELLLWRKDPLNTDPSYYVQLDGRESRNTILRVMRESGIKVTTINMSAGPSAYAQQVQEATEALFA